MSEENNKVLQHYTQAKQYQGVIKADNLKGHHQKCSSLFEKILEGKEIYVHFDQEIKEEASYIRVSILTKRIIRYDRETFSIDRDNRQSLIANYRPYFSSFLIENGPEERNTLRKLQGNQGSGESQWYVGQIETLAYGDNNVLANEGLLAVTGILEMSASPVNYLENKRLVFMNEGISKEVLAEINETYSCSKFAITANRDIEMELNAIWNEDMPNMIDIYNVGHGNADYIRGRKSRILYDVGYSYRQYPGKNRSGFVRAEKAIRDLKPHCVILSHWDMDHIIGCAYANQALFRSKWIAPSLTSSNQTNYKPSVNAVRLAKYLDCLGNLYLVDRSKGAQKVAEIVCRNRKGSGEINLWLGGGTDSNITKQNQEGLIIEIKASRSCHTVLAGDVPYKCWPKKILDDKIDMLHVPHHCSKMQLISLSSVVEKGEEAIITTNRRKGKVLNLDLGHYKHLKQYFDKVSCTIEHPSGDDTKNLAIRIHYLRNTTSIR